MFWYWISIAELKKSIGVPVGEVVCPRASSRVGPAPDQAARLPSPNVIAEHEERFTTTVVELLSGKLSVANAEARAESFNRHALRYDTMVMADADTASAISDIYNFRAKRWKADAWPGRLDFLRERPRN